MNTLIRKILLSTAIALAICDRCPGQAITDTIYADLDIATCTPVSPRAGLPVTPGSRGIRVLPPVPGKAKKIEILKVGNNSFVQSRKASLHYKSYGTILAFDKYKTDGREKVIVFAAKEEHRDSLLVYKDTLYFKAITDKHTIYLSIVYPKTPDTVIVKCGYIPTMQNYRPVRHYDPVLKDHAHWLLENQVSNLDTYTLVRRENQYETVMVETTRENLSAYEQQEMKQRFSNAGSLFWIALEKL